MSPVRDVTGTLRARRAAARRRLAIRIAMGLVVAVVVGGLVWLVVFSQVFASRTIVVKGTSILTTDEVTTAARIPLGVPLARLNTAAGLQRVAALKPVASANVARSWPNGVIITVVERSPAYVLTGPAGDELVDATGLPFAATAGAHTGLLRVTAASTDPRLLADAAVVVAALPPAVREATEVVSAESRDRIVVLLTTGSSVMWGSAAESPLKAQVAEALLKQPAKVYDVSSPSHPTTRQ